MNFETINKTLFFAGLDNEQEYFKITEKLRDNKKYYCIDISDCIYEEYNKVNDALNKLF